MLILHLLLYATDSYASYSTNMNKVSVAFTAELHDRNFIGFQTKIPQFSQPIPKFT